MEYLKKSFTVAPGKAKAYRDNYDSVFGKKKPTISVRKELQPKKKASR